MAADPTHSEKRQVTDYQVFLPNLRHLRVLVEVARAHGISAAAERVHLSQPAVTQAISGLERSFGARLFERRRDGMFPTPEGEMLARRVGRMLAVLGEGAARAARLAGRRAERASPGFEAHLTATQLRALVAIAEAGSFSLAARRLGLSQPSVHRAGRDLERLSGLGLFAPARSGVDLTPAGEALARAARLAMAELRQAEDDLTRLAGHDSTRIAVGSMPLSRTALLPMAIEATLGEAPRARIRLVDAPYGELLRALRDGALDVLIGALREPPPAEDIVQERLFDDGLAIMAGPSHPLAGARGLALEDTLAFPWIAPPKDSPTGRYLYRLLDIGARPETPVRVVTSSMVLVRGLLARGDFLTILSPRQAATEIERGAMVPLDIALPGSARPIGLTTRAGWEPTRTQARFLDHLRRAAGALAAPPYSNNQ
ncbi:MAG: LysR family transcriptional regulator [Alphaproteobacteria bacterium]|nr:MAG: LysR family transcriptional regulator [Alphaproteobacteria bacterium]